MECKEEGKVVATFVERLTPGRSARLTSSLTTSQKKRQGGAHPNSTRVGKAIGELGGETLRGCSIEKGIKTHRAEGNGGIGSSVCRERGKSVFKAH